MDREKLNEAILTHISELEKTYAFNSEFATIVMDVWDKAIDWLMQQPLSERLTEEEKEKIRKLQGEIFKEIMDAHDAEDWQSAAHYILDVMPRTFASIFGADLFREK